MIFILAAEVVVASLFYYQLVATLLECPSAGPVDEGLGLGLLCSLMWTAGHCVKGSFLGVGRHVSLFHFSSFAVEAVF